MSKKIALVTGGTGGIGTAICQALSNDGFKVITTYRSAEKAGRALDWQETMKSQGFDVETVCMDVSNWASCVKAAEEIKTTYGRISVLVNNAGITRDSVMKKMDVSQWDDVIQTNLNGVFYVTKQFLDEMIEEGFGRIINISSINGQKGQFGQVNYSAAKAGLHGFTKALAQEVARKGVTVNTLSPGYIATSMIMAIDEPIREKIKAQIPVGRFGEPEEMARIISFLASGESGFITGADLSANGGQHMH